MVNCSVKGVSRLYAPLTIFITTRIWSNTSHCTDPILKGTSSVISSFDALIVIPSIPSTPQVTLTRDFVSSALAGENAPSFQVDRLVNPHVHQKGVLNADTDLRNGRCVAFAVLNLLGF